MGTHWYCAGYLRNREALAIEQLERQGYRAFCPRVQKTTARAGGKAKRSVPLFPGYLFVELDLDLQRWRPIDGTIGITELVKCAGRPARLRTRFVDRLMRKADADGVVSFDEPMRPGDRVRTVGGALDDTLGTLVRLKGGDRVVVLMSMIGRAVEVTLPRGRLISAV